MSLSNRSRCRRPRATYLRDPPEPVCLPAARCALHAAVHEGVCSVLFARTQRCPRAWLCAVAPSTRRRVLVKGTARVLNPFSVFFFWGVSGAAREPLG
jgi:hypothetical protein